MNILIVGCGRVGAELAKTCDKQNHDVTVVDNNPHAFRRLTSDFRGTSIVGTGIDEDVLISADIENTDHFYAVTNWDNTNLMAAQIAHKIFSIKHVAARIYDPVRAHIFESMGIRTICSTTIISQLFLDLLDDSDVNPS